MEWVAWMTYPQGNTKLFGYGSDLAGNCRSVISCYFLHFLNKLILKSTIRYIRIYNKCTGQSKIDHVLFYTGFCPNFSEYFNITSWIKYFKSLSSSRNQIIIFRKIRTKTRVEKSRFDRFWIALYIGCKYLCIVQNFLSLIYLKIA